MSAPKTHPVVGVATMFCAVCGNVMPVARNKEDPPKFVAECRRCDKQVYIATLPDNAPIVEDEYWVRIEPFDA